MKLPQKCRSCKLTFRLISPQVAAYLLALLLLMAKMAIAAPKVNELFFKADKIYYDQNRDIAHAKGSVVIYHQDKILQADSLTLDFASDIVYATGNVVMQSEQGETITGHQVLFKQDLKEGIITEFAAKLASANGGSGIIASRFARRKDEQHYELYKSVYTPCTLYCGGKPIWQINAQQANIDLEKKNVKYDNMFFAIFGQPVFYLPYFSHPTPDAEAQSGLLVPYSQNGAYVQPIYLRLSPSADATISPRLNNKFFLSEYEIRQITRDGAYNVRGSVGTPKDINVNKNYRHHLFAVGDFKRQDWQYGCDIKLTSDKSYLKNYLSIYDSHLPSNIYLRRVNKANYVSAEGLYYQGLNADADFNAGPMVLPKFRSKNIIPLVEDGTLDLTVRSNILGFKEAKQKEIGRGGVGFLLSSNYINSLGQRFAVGMLNKFDYYIARYKNINNVTKETATLRHIPELKAAFSWPFLVDNNRGRGQNIIIEPLVSAAHGRKHRPRRQKIAEFAPSQPDFEISSYNLLDTNKFAGNDFHEFGTRVNYGSNIRLWFNQYRFNAFLGQATFRNDVISNSKSELVGRLSSSYGSNFFVDYNFRRDKEMQPILDEVNTNLQYGMFGVNLQYFYFNTLLKDNVTFSNVRRKILRLQPKLKQASATARLNLNKKLLASFSTRVDIRNEKWKILSRTIRVTYNLDCVSIMAKVENDYTADYVRGIRKSPNLDWSNLTFAVGLRFLNF